MYYSKEGPNVQSQSEHSAYKHMNKVNKSKFSTDKERADAVRRWEYEKTKTQIRESGGFLED